MEVGDFVRNAWVHIRGVLLGAVLVGCLAAVVSLASPHPYSATSTLRVVPPGGSLDTDLLSTSVEWYAALGDVPAVLNTASNRTQPAVSTTTMRAATSLAPGSGPGEILITATAPDEQQAVSMNNALAVTLVQTVNKDEELQLGGTGLSVLLPAEPQGQSGAGMAAIFLSGFLATFVVLFTAGGLLHPFINWRINARVLRAIGVDLRVPVLPDMPDLGLVLGMQARAGAQTWIAATAQVPTAAFTALQQQVEELGSAVQIVEITDSGKATSAGVGTVYLPDPNDASPAAIAAASLAAVPATVLVVSRSRTRQVRDFLDRLEGVGVPVLAFGLVSKKAGELKSR